MSSRDTILFPRSSLPVDTTEQRLAGLYPQRQPGLWMQRLKCLAGRLSSIQWRAIADVAEEFAPGMPVHLTTRQDIEFHDIKTGQVGPLHRALSDAGLAGTGSGGDTLRNITVSPSSGALHATPDLHPLASEVRTLLEALQETWNLPRKFKISFSLKGESPGPWISDLGFVLDPSKTNCGFRAVVAGSLGPSPGLAIPFGDGLTPVEVVRLCLTAILVFHRLGDRKVRSRARLRHLREHLGDQEFLRVLRREFDQLPQIADILAPEIRISDTGLQASRALIFPFGNLLPSQARNIAKLAERNDIRVRISTHQSVIVFGANPQGLSSVLDSLPWIPKASAPPIVCCPGNDSCSHAIVDTRYIAGQLGELLDGACPWQTVCVSGCPNGCALSRVAPLGLSGVTRSGRDCFDVYSGGEMGHSPSLSQCRARAVASEDLPDLVRGLQNLATEETPNIPDSGGLLR